MPAQVHGGGLHVQRLPVAKMLLFIALVGFAHVTGQGAAGRLHKLQVRPPAHGLAVDVKRGDWHGMQAQLVVKSKAVFRAI